MDGGSSDNSVEIIIKYEKHFTYWQSKPDGGQSAAINEGFKHAIGEVYCWLNSDDQIYENALLIIGGCSRKQGLVGIIEALKDNNEYI